MKKELWEKQMQNICVRSVSKVSIKRWIRRMCYIYSYSYLSYSILLNLRHKYLKTHRPLFFVWNQMLFWNQIPKLYILIKIEWERICSPKPIRTGGDAWRKLQGWGGVGSVRNEGVKLSLERRGSGRNMLLGLGVFFQVLPYRVFLLLFSFGVAFLGWLVGWLGIWGFFC